MTSASASPLLTAPIGPMILRLAAPNVVSNIASMTAMMAEAWYIGQLGVEPLAGLALAFPMMMLMMMLSGGSFGGTIAGAVARRLGAGDRAGAEEVALHAVLLVVLLAALSGLVFLLGGRAIYSALGGSGTVLEQALAYSDTLFLGCISIWLSGALSAIVRATGHMTVAARRLVASSILQVIIGGTLVFGLGPFPKLGIAGAAAGIVISSTFSAVMLLHFLLKRSTELRLRFSGIPLRLEPMAAILRVGAMASINSMSSLVAVIVITGFMARFGVDVLAGFGIGSRLEFLIIPLVFGFGAASTAIVGVHFGAKATERGLRVGWTAAFYSAAVSGSVGAMLALFPDFWANLFTEAETVRAACRAYLQIVGPFYAFLGVGLCLYFASQGAGRLLWPVIAALMRVLVVVIGCLALAQYPDARPEHFFWLIAAGMAVQAMVSGTAIRLGAWTAGPIFRQKASQ
jgi:putative MATE family efflux protein